ncbi:adenylate kinase-domain-containing protein [Lentinula lateritia]|uniref:Adenylate kinase-domain-containing protein n=1 Tax=Lentinula lateritia TaxID=40482 RepID=A0ABQ8UY39_9AGAR|nr:adenylate kinase-domain-containing protein [Lentinula lateritia]
MQIIRNASLTSHRMSIRTSPTRLSAWSAAARSFSSSSPASLFRNSLQPVAHDEAHSDPRHARMLRMLMFGKPGAGKGTLSGRLVKKYDIVSLSTGDLLRMHINDRTEVGRMAEEIVAQGGLVPDELMLQVVTSKLDRLHNKHWILDGFPRTFAQGELLNTHLNKQNTPLSLVVNLDVPDDIILSRISDRWVHLPSGRVYNLSYNPPKVEGFDDETGEPLTKRPDDNPEIFARRLEKFYSTTSPLLDFYARLSQAHISTPPHRHPHQHPHQLAFHTTPPHRLMMQSISGTTSDEIWPELERVLKDAFPGLKERVESADARRRHSLSDAIASASMNAAISK